MSQYKVYAADLNIYGTVGVVITSAYQNAGGYHKAESFVLIPGNDGALFPRKLSFEVKSFEGSPIELNEELMLEAALEHAKIDLASYLESQDKEGGLMGLLEAPKLLEDNKNLLVHIWLRGRANQLNEVYKKTECDELKEYIGVILKLPIISSEEL